MINKFCSVQFSYSVMSDSLRLHGLQHARLPCSSPTPGACSNARPSIQSVIGQPSHPLSSPSPPAINLSQHQGLFKWVSSSHQVAKVLGVSASASVLPMNIQDWFPLGLTGWISFLIFANLWVQGSLFPLLVSMRIFIFPTEPFWGPSLSYCTKSILNIDVKG